MRRTLVALAVTPLLLFAFGMSPANAQTGSPGGEQPSGADQAPPQGGPAGGGVNSGGEDEGGNRTSPGGAGATGTTPGDRSTGTDLGKALGFIAVLALVCLAAFLLIRRRGRPAEERLQADVRNR